MQTIARTILESFLFEKKTLTPADLQVHQNLREKVPVFVTLSDGDTIVASSGRIYPVHETAAEELIENTILASKDPRFESYINNPEKARKLSYRVDIFHDDDRRLLHHPDELDTATEGIIVLCQKQQKVGIILPHILPSTLSWEEVYHHAIKKISLDTQHLGKWDVILYGVKTIMFRDGE